MFAVLRSIFRKFRMVARAVRAGVAGIAVVLGLWIFLAPASQTEITHLSLSPESSLQIELLRAHRMAKVLMVVGNDRIYQLVAARAGQGMTADDVRLSVVMAAGGSPRDLRETAPDADTSGAKFVAARTD